MEVESYKPLSDSEAAARFIREQIPKQGLFTGHDWRISPRQISHACHRISFHPHSHHAGSGKK